jgi:hypothetical protein
MKKDKGVDNVRSFPIHRDSKFDIHYFAKK